MLELCHRLKTPIYSTDFICAPRDFQARPSGSSHRSPIDHLLQQRQIVTHQSAKSLAIKRTKRTDQLGRISFFISYVTTATTCHVQLVKLFATSCENARRSTAKTSLEVMLEPPIPSRPFLQSQPRLISAAALPFSCDCAKYDEAIIS